VSNSVPGPPASVLAAIIRADPAHPYDPATQARRATFSASNWPDLPSLTTDVVALPQYALLDANLQTTGYLSTQGLPGAVAASRWMGGTTSGAPVSGTFLVGDFVVDQSGKMWICVTAGTPGSWTAGSGSTNVINGVTVSGTPARGQVLTATGLTSADWANAPVDWLNAVTAYGADPTGGSDSTTAIQNALSAIPAGGGTVYLPAGTYLLNTASFLSVAIAGTRLTGAGIATQLQIGASFTGAQVLSVTADSCVVSDLSIVGASSTITSNPVCKGIVVTGAQHCRLRDVYFQYINGWALESKSAPTKANYDLMGRGLTVRNCAGGVHVQSVTGTSWQAEHFFTDVQCQQIGTASGGSANLDAFMTEDAKDILVENLNVGVVAGTGHAIHVKGQCASVFFTNPDVGGGTDVVLVEDSTNGSGSNIRFTSGTFQAPSAGNCLHVTGGYGQVVCTSIYFRASWASGVAASNTGSPCELNGCRWNTSNQSGGTGYDLDLTSASARWIVHGGAFATTVGSGAGRVTNPVNDPAVVGYFFGTSFVGTGTTNATAFAAGPAVGDACPGFSVAAAPAVFAPANPGSTASATLVMMGLGSTCTYTPTGKGKVLVGVTGVYTNLTAAANVNIGPRYGTGTAPANGVAVTGTRFGGAADVECGSSLSPVTRPFAFTDVLSLTAGTAYWFDLGLSTTNIADAADVLNVSMTFTEVG